MTPMKPDDLTIDHLPRELSERLQAMIRRVRRLILVRGILTAAVVLFGCSLAIMAIDAGVMIFSSFVRWILTTAALALVVATAWRVLVQPLMQPLTLTRMARVLETRHPELQERISSAIELLTMGGDAAAAGSAQLIQLLARDAQADISGVTPRHEFTGRSLKPVVLCGAVIVGIFAMLFVVWPGQTSLLLARAMAPFANLSDLQGAGLRVEPGDVLCAEGGDLTFRLIVKGRGQSRAEMHREMGTGSKSSERMLQVSPEGEQPVVYELTYPTVTKSFRYRMRYGTGLTRYYDVTVLPPPSVTRMVITCQYPEYTEHAPRVMPDGARDILGLAGGRVTIEADFNRKSEAVFLLGDQRIDGAATTTGGATWDLNLATNMPDSWGLSLVDKHGFTNEIEWASLRVVPDRAPVVDLQSPRAPKLTLPPYGQLTFACTISEDFGLATTELVIDPQGFNTEMQTLPLEVTAGGDEYWSGLSEVELGLLDLGGSQKFIAWVRVTDTLPQKLGGPQEGVSRKVEITIDDSAARIEDQLRKEQKTDIVEMLKRAAELLTQAADEVTTVKDRTAVELLPPPVIEALTTAHDHAASAVDLVMDAAGVAARSPFAPLGPRIQWTARQVVDPARADTAEISDTEAANRRKQSDKAIASLRIAASRVLALIPGIEAMDVQLAEIAKIEALADRERTLAALAEQKKMTQAEMQAWRQEQAKISEALAAQKKINEEAAEQARKEMDAAQAAMLKEEQQLAQQQAEQQQAQQPDAKSSEAKASEAKAKESKGSPKEGKGKGKGKGKGEGKGSKGKGQGKGKGQDGEPSNSQMASESAAKAAQSMSQMASQMTSQMASEMASAMEESMATAKSVPGKGGNARGKTGPFSYAAEDFETGIPDSEWARIKGKSNAGALADSLQNVPPEYRDLVRRYFVELAREGTESRGEKAKSE